jgi:hypothetical protein
MKAKWKLLLDRVTTAVASPILVILMSPKVDAFPVHTLTPAKHNRPATMGTNGFARRGIGSRNRLLALGVLGNFHCWATFIQAVLLLALPYLTLFTVVCHRLLRIPANYFDELVERVRRIRTSEKQFYRKVLDIFATN